ncbi:PIN domain-containing protein [Galbitalea sp. SE-J8]|uniref:PIN domain-containing protein n=1 Tax=Galbitalea sp. SE-J8 TaxID=3054952 RepID=UPI00259C9312|nr:PIN domain-containing protein [Galbitalea sp. SE-J8]MDM4761656.1 PIN domain-containing protein [Galbitalea sp. SE-J8]
MSFPAFFDTNVLYGALLNDFILEIADRGLFRPLWSKDVLFELAKNLVKNGEDPVLAVEPFDLEVVHPDDFLLDQLDLYHAPTLRALVELVEGYGGTTDQLREMGALGAHHAHWPVVGEPGHRGLCPLGCLDQPVVGAVPLERGHCRPSWPQSDYQSRTGASREKSACDLGFFEWLRPASIR